MKTLKDLIKDKPMHFVKSGMKIIDVAKFMGLHNIGAVPVLEQSEKLKLIGIFSERDLLRKCIAKEINLFETPVDDVMTKKVIVIDSDDTPEYCMQIMKQENIRHMPVIEGQDLKGIISIRDLMLYDMNQKEEKIEMLNSYIQFNG
ncbi:MAG TPA: CBS domain-containing protein [Ignavibacteria bacterium]|nr:IMP dehydrogenase [Bacteroidota bacterium]HRI84731.1 CBS domain-containing protein [Ignavibacteria bacterium]HRK00511.1 CBS domain-containing protein [Ignavibacteria bacterium]